jgi:hypothetical protein
VLAPGLSRRQDGPNVRTRRFALVAAVLAAGGITAILLGGKGEVTPTHGSATPPPQCLKLPSPIPTPSWLPATLPLPKGSFATQTFDPVQGIERGLFVVAAPLDGFVRFVLREWPAKGWSLGPGESEPGEAEDTFTDEAGLFGQFRARSDFCRTDRTQVLIAIAKVPDLAARLEGLER